MFASKARSYSSRVTGLGSALRVLEIGGAGNFGGTKKERRLAPPLRVEVSELRLQKTADLPRPFQLRPVPALCLRSPVRGPSTPALFIDVFRPPGFACFRLLCRWLPGSRPSALGSVPALAFPFPGPSRAEAPSGPRPYSSRSCFLSLDLPLLSLLPVLGPVEALASWRLSPGIAFPFRVAPSVRPALTEPGPGDMLSTK